MAGLLFPWEVKQLKVYVILVHSYEPGDCNRSKVSQQGYKTFEEAQQFCMSRSAKRITSCCNGYVFWADGIRYEIVEVSI